jgi:hypothetical protein
MLYMWSQTRWNLYKNLGLAGEVIPYGHLPVQTLTSVLSVLDASSRTSKLANSGAEI